MSMKNRVLLHRTGRDQFGNKGESPLKNYVPTDEQEEIFRLEKEKHETLNDAFCEKHSKDWLNLFTSKSKKEIWKTLFPFGKPALGTFYSSVREHDSVSDFLIYWLVANKQKSMKILGYEQSEIKDELSQFSNCGRYFVTFGKGKAFSTVGI